MQTLTARYRVTTPLFIGAPESPETVELNLRGLKGAVRFWWRALNYARLTNDGKNLKALHEAEARLFGAAADERNKDRGRSPVLWRVGWDDGKEPKREKQQLPGASGKQGIAYLGGQGLGQAGNQAGQLRRECFWDPQGMVMVVRVLAPGNFPFHTGGNWTAEGQSLSDALLLLGLLGGIGSRKSRGFGSLVLESLQIEGGAAAPATVYQTVKDYETALRSLFDRYEVTSAKALPEFPALSDLSRIWLLADQSSTEGSTASIVANDPLSLLDHIGKQMVRYRSYGAFPRDRTTRQIIPGRPRQTILGEPPEQNFEPDHHFAKQMAGFEHLHPERIAFGMPQGYTSCQVRSVKPNGQERRGSPLLLHIHRLAGGKYFAVAAMLPARLTPNGEIGIVMPGHPSDKPLPRGLMTNFEQTRAWEVLEEFVTGKVGPAAKKTTTPYFNAQRAIWP